MRLILFIACLSAALSAPPLAAPSNDDEFLSQEEYQIHLWRNPRGIGCDHCHGKAGEEVEFASYLDENKQRHVVKIASIQNISWQRFYSALRGKSGVKNIMPDYHLTDKEIKNLYLYIKKSIPKKEKK